ncbi:hypothetical protein HYW87_03420 [Candidatus Roizmanbacteria bacterium]|nr:hypothetical protein [Candidatus Roizmanbacteria bacterium]
MIIEQLLGNRGRGNDDARYTYEMSRNTHKVIPSPPFEKPGSAGFIDGLGYLEDEENAINLPRRQVRWNHVLFEQAQVFRHVVAWYIEQITSGGILIPAVAYRHPDNNNILVISNGTTRMVALYQIVYRSHTPLSLADKRNVTVA